MTRGAKAFGERGFFNVEGSIGLGVIWLSS